MSRKNDEALFDELASDLEYEPVQTTPAAEPIKDPGVEEREIQQMVELINQIKLLRQDVAELMGDTDLYLVNLNDKANFVSSSFRELDLKISSWSSALKQITDIKNEMQEALDKNQFTYKVSEESLKRMTKQVNDAINKAYDAVSKDAYRCASEYLRKGIEATLKDGENRIQEFSETLQKMRKIQTENEGGIWVPMKVLFYLVPVITIGFCFGVWGFTQYINHSHQMYLGIAFVVALASEFLWSIGKAIYERYWLR